MTESTVHEACRLIVSTERQIVPVLERCYELAGRHDCLEEVDELVSIHRHVLDDCHELMAVMGVEDTSALVDITIPDDFGTCIIVIHRHFVRVIDDGYIIIDPRASDPGQKSVLERVTGRKAEQMRLLRRIAEKCGISLSGADDRLRDGLTDPRCLNRPRKGQSMWYNRVTLCSASPGNSVYP